MTPERVAASPSFPPDGHATAMHAMPERRWLRVCSRVQRVCLTTIGMVVLAGGVALRRAEASVPATAGATATVDGVEDTTRFSHARHRTVKCTTCHATGRSHGELLVRDARDCAACHHERSATATTCGSCHSERELGKRIAVREPVSLSVWKAPRTRELGFRHAPHERYECKSCHARGVELAVDRSCGSCHVEHHEPDANCTACHATAPPRDAHVRDVVHRGCAGSSCHDDASVAALPAQRNVCLVCHTKAVDHKPGRDCASCHQVKWPVAARGGLPRDQ